MFVYKCVFASRRSIILVLCAYPVYTKETTITFNLYKSAVSRFFKLICNGLHEGL